MAEEKKKKRSSTDALFEAHQRLLKYILKTSQKAFMHYLEEQSKANEAMREHIMQYTYSIDNEAYKRYMIDRMNGFYVLDKKEIEDLDKKTREHTKETAKESIYAAIDEIKKELKV